MNAFIANKVGSGFDIAASIYGSQLYKRFSNTAILKDRLVPFLLSKLEDGKLVYKSDFEEFNQLFKEFVSGFGY